MKVTEERKSICNWPTDVVAIDHCVTGESTAQPHTLILFIPGNPGVVHWYIDFLERVLQLVGDGFAVRGISYAGHGVGVEVVGTRDDHNFSMTKADKNTEGVLNDEGQDNQQKNMSIAWTMDGQGKHFHLPLLFLVRKGFPCGTYSKSPA